MYTRRRTGPISPRCDRKRLLPTEHHACTRYYPNIMEKYKNNYITFLSLSSDRFEKFSWIRFKNTTKYSIIIIITRSAVPAHRYRFSGRPGCRGSHQYSLSGRCIIQARPAHEGPSKVDKCLRRGRRIARSIARSFSRRPPLPAVTK